MTKPFIIGIGSVARVGKDTAAEGLCQNLAFKRIGFADRLKAVALEADPLVTASVQTMNVNIGHGRLKWVVGGMGWEQAKNVYPEVRRFLQELGLGARKVFGKTFWIDQAMLEATGHERVVFSDVRFINEAEAIRAAGGFVVRVNPPGYVGKGHVSETELDGFDFDEEFNNDGSIVELQEDIVAWVRNKLETQEKQLKLGEAS